MVQEKNDATDLKVVQELKEAREKILEQLRKVIVGQQHVIDELLIALLSNGHCLLVGVPGLAKTMLIRTISQTLDLSFNRIQFTPDLMPSDIVGTELVEEEMGTGKRVFRFIKGPIFANIVLADEINRTPPKTQAALLQAMQEREVTAAGETYPLHPPFFVLATQNPIEQEGTYPLPEAQLDRFMFNIYVDYPSQEEEIDIVKTTTSSYQAAIEPVLSAEKIIELQQLVRRVPVSDHVVKYAVQLVRSTRPSSSDFQWEFKKDGDKKMLSIKELVSWGAGPRASQYLILGAKTRAILDGRYTPECSDVRALAPAVLRHRIVTSFNAEAEGIDTIEIINELIKGVKED